MKKTKILIAISTLGLAGLNLANAQDLASTSTQPQGFGARMMQNLTDAQKTVLDQAKKLFEAGKKDEAKTLLEQNGIRGPAGRGQGMKGKMMNRKAMEDAIIAGNFQAFQSVASTSPLAKIDQTTFNLLVPQFQAKKSAETQIQAILKNAGITPPQGRTPGHGPGANN
jgi:hypothetical protein